MRRDDLRTLFEYDAWATERLLATAEGLDDGAFATLDLGTQFAHYFLAREGFRGVVARTPRSFAALRAEYDQMDFSTADRCRAWLENERAATEETLRAITDVDLEEDVTVGAGDLKRTMSPWSVVTHLVNHGTHHRSEIARVLTDAARSPGNLDFILFVRGSG